MYLQDETALSASCPHTIHPVCCPCSSPNKNFVATPNTDAVTEKNPSQFLRKQCIEGSGALWEKQVQSISPHRNLQLLPSCYRLSAVCFPFQGLETGDCQDVDLICTLKSILVTQVSK